jgi:tetratricopeptide (TPR) repeat protein
MKKNKRDLTESEEVENPLEIDEIKEEPVHLIEKIQLFIQENTRWVIIGGIAFVAIIAYLFYFSSSSVKSSNEASVALSRVLSYYTTMDYELALNGNPAQKVRGEAVIGLLKIVDTYKRTEQGKVAALYAANCYIGLKKYDQAENYFKIAKGSGSDIVKSGAYGGLGICAELKNDFKEAASKYEEAAELSADNAGKPRYQYYAAMNYEKSGDKKKAENLYREIIGATPFSEFSGMAKSGLSRLGMIIE